MAAPKSYQGIIDLTYKELDKNREIVLQDCNRYVKGLTKSGRNNKVRETKVKEVAKQFNTGRACLDKYITVGLGMAGRPTIILRFFGREVARIFLNDNKDKMFTISNPGKLPLENNSKDKSLRELNNRFKKRFENNGLDINKEYEWDSPEGKAFRRIFINKDAKTNLAITNEHYFESQLLSDLSLNLKKGKSLPFIQPIKYAGCRLQFPTKLKASAAKEDNVEYSRKGGGIDVLARRKIGHTSVLCAIELKDESLSNEKPQKAIKQAIAYATFIDYILRENGSEGLKWLKIFGLDKQGYDKKPMAIYAIVVMPIGEYSNESSGCKFVNLERVLELRKYKFGDKEMSDILKLHYLYFDKAKLEKGKTPVKIITSLRKG